MPLGYVPSKDAMAQERRNRDIRPGYSSTRLSEALGIDCSYETSPLACSVDERAGKILVKKTGEMLAGPLSGRA